MLNNQLYKKGVEYMKQINASEEKATVAHDESRNLVYMTKLGHIAKFMGIPVLVIN